MLREPLRWTDVYFDSDVSKWCFDLEPARYAGHLTVVDRFVAGLIQPPTSWRPGVDEHHAGGDGR